MLRAWLSQGRKYHDGQRRGRRATNRSGWAHSLPLTLEPLESLTLLSLSAPLAFELGLASARVAVADANGDGLPDLLGSDGERRVSALLGRGDGTFQPALLSNPGPAGSMVGDVNGDGTPDLAGPEFDFDDGFIFAVNTVLGNGDGTFRPGGRLAFDFEANTVTPGDFDGDGLLDLAVTSNRLTMYLGNGDGTFRPGPVTPVSAVTARAADLDGDGRLDLVVLNGSAVGVLLGRGDGSFQNPVPYPTGLVLAGFLALADFNGDGAHDLIAGGGSAFGVVSVLFGNGDGSFQPARTSNLGIPLGTPADLNGDGLADMIAAVGAGQVRVFLSNGDGSFQPAFSFSAGSAPFTVGVADFNGDGALDLALGSFVGGLGMTGSAVSVLFNNGDGTFPLFPAPHPVNFLSGRLATGDFNGDGAPDLVTVSSSPAVVSVVLSNGDGSFRPQIDTRLFQIFLVGLTVADFDGDGRLDVAVTIDQWEKVVILLGLGDGTFGAPIDVPTGRFSSRLVAADLNGDGVPDLAVLAKNAAAADGVYVHLGNGDGTFGAALITSVDRFPSDLAAGDFNADGVTDLAVANTAATSVLVGNGDGTFQQPLRYAGGRTVAVARLRPGGPEDLITVSWALPDLNGSISVLLGNGDGTFQKRVDYPVGRGPFGVVVTDLNGDGLPDVAVNNGHGGTVSVLLGNGDGSLRAGPGFVVGSLPGGMVAGDFNGDGLPDLMVANAGSGNISRLFNDGVWSGAGPGSGPSGGRGTPPAPQWASDLDLLTRTTPASTRPTAAEVVGPARRAQPVTAIVDRVFAAGTGETRRLARLNAVLWVEDGADLWGALAAWGA